MPGEIGIDDGLIVQLVRKEEAIEMMNGCICCTGAVLVLFNTLGLARCIVRPVVILVHTVYYLGQVMCSIAPDEPARWFCCARVLLGTSHTLRTSVLQCEGTW